jgi:peptide deformylase
MGMNAVESAALQPSRDCATAEPQFGELGPADDAVLSLCARPQPFCVDFHPRGGRNLTQLGHWANPRPPNAQRRHGMAAIHCRTCGEIRTTRLEVMSDEVTPTPVEELDGEQPIEASEPEGVDAEALERRSAALAQVIKFGDPVLRSAASPVTEFDEELESEAERMIGLMRDAIGVGLAATQLGILRRMLVFQVGSEAEPTVLVNPEIEWRSEEELATAEEGCLSLPGVIVDVERPLHVRARGMDVHGEPFSIEASGLEARVIQHEVDHLDGVLMIDRAERDQKRGALRALREGGTYAPERPEDDEMAESSSAEE